MNYRGLPFKAERIEFYEIEETYKKIGASPASKKGDGTDSYTLPVIYDSRTGRAIADSHRISEYLEETYPDTPKMFPALNFPSNTHNGETTALSTKAAILLFEQFFLQNVATPWLPILLPMVTTILPPRSSVGVRRALEIDYKCKLEDISPAGSTKRAEDWTKVKEGLDKLAAIMDQSDAKYFLGDTLSRADVIVIAFLFWMRVVVEKEDWEMVANANGGRWGRLMEETKALQVVED